MKNLAVLLTLLLGNLYVCGQHLSFKPGDRFSYEFLFFEQSESRSAFFERLDFEVLKNYRNQGFLLSVRLNRSISSFSSDVFTQKLTDTKYPPNVYEEESLPVFKYLLSKIPFTITIDSLGNLISFNNLDSVTQNILDNGSRWHTSKYGQSLAQSIKIKLSTDGLKNITDRIFQRSALSERLDTTFKMKNVETNNVNRNGKMESVSYTSLDVVHLTKRIEVSNRLMINYLSIDSTVAGFYEGTKKAHHYLSSIFTALVFTNIKGLKVNPSLFPKLNKYIGYSDDSSDLTAVIMELRQIQKSLFSDKDPQLKSDAAARLNVLDSQTKKKNLSYLAEKASVMAQIDLEKYNLLIKAVPATYLTNTIDLNTKIQQLYSKKNKTEFIQSLKLFFEKFKTEGDYPDNINFLEYLIHHKMAYEVLYAKSSIELMAYADLIKEIDGLKIAPLSALFTGIKYWIAARHTRDTKALTGIAAQEFNSKYDNFARYRSMIYHELATKLTDKNLLEKYLDCSVKLLENNIDNSGGAYNTVYRKYLADTYYLKSQTDSTNEMRFLKMAADYAKDQNDQRNISALAEEGPYSATLNYPAIYIEKSDLKLSDEVISAFVDLVILHPERFIELKKKYQTKYPRANFKLFFSNALKERLPQTLSFKLEEIRTGEDFDYSAISGKYVFIDFWGTWCVPCVNEIQEIESLYKVLKGRANIVVTTVACLDKPEVVRKFIFSRGLTMPVLMSDAVIEKKFKIDVYPTKVLILPNHSYVILPYNSDYKRLVEAYASWEL